ncbi:MAG: signal recognition particle-docking protein FtsY [bacterium]|nr:signal recognition particle-docking protein FtsY [bacterium]
MGFFQALAKTRDRLDRALRKLVGNRLGDEAADELEEALILADAGPAVAAGLVERLRELYTGDGTDPRELLARLVAESLPPVPPPYDGPPPEVLLLVGVNGTGKTTTAAKLAARYARDGKRVLLAAADTYRAAAGEQLEVWAERAGVPLVRHAEGGDPGAVLYDALEAAKARRMDAVIADTAGRMHTRDHLMRELGKLRRVVEKSLGEHPVGTALVLDAGGGQNGVLQARAFLDGAGCDRIVLTKLDGTSRGGFLLAVAAETGLPISHVGTGERLEDLEPFDPMKFARALVGLD